MRVIGGTLKGRKFASPKGIDIRPTADRLRESIFNIISTRVEDANVLDMFAGTGAFGIEALSRRARLAVFIDSSRSAAAVIASNLKRFHLEERSHLILANIEDGLDRLSPLKTAFDIVFMDPPYNRGFVSAGLKQLRCHPICATDNLLIIEHSLFEQLPADLSGFVHHDTRRYGKTLVSFLEYML